VTDKFPVRIHRRDDGGAATFLATTALVKLADSPEQVQAQLRESAAAYSHALTEACAALAEARHDASARARAYWRVGKSIRDFEAFLDAAGFYLVAQTETFARDLGVHPGSLRKILAFQSKFPDASMLDEQKAWTRYRDRDGKA
jgi:phytoene dehydrogenase-like protein